MTKSTATLTQQNHAGLPLWIREVSPQHSPLFFAHIKQLAGIIIALGFGFGLWVGDLKYTAPRAGLAYIGNGIYHLPEGTSPGNSPQGLDSRQWNNVVIPRASPE